MAHIFDILSTVNGQLNILAKDFSGEGKARTLPRIPDLVVLAVNRGLSTIPGIEIDPGQNTTVSKALIASTGDETNPVYMCVADNIIKPIIDKFPIMVNRKDRSCSGTAYIVIIPQYIYQNDAEIEKVSVILRDIYFGLLDLDPNMSYSAEIIILRLLYSQKVRILSYDVSMIVAALCCIYANLNEWFVTDQREPIDESYALTSFTKDELDDETRKNVKKVISNYRDIESLRGAIGSGSLLKDLLYME